MVSKKIVKKKSFKKNKITFVKIYLTEGDKLLKAIMQYLHDELHIKGVTVFRAITGFGKSGAYHSSEILTLSLDLPLAIEFFDEPKKIKIALAHLQKMLQPGHIVTWNGECI